MPRADQILVERGLAHSRSQAQRLIAAGVTWRVGSQTWQRVDKNGALVPQEAELQLQDDAETKYVSRGGLKLAGALRETGIKPQGLHCLDVGQSTGGFTDCLLQHGAVQVTGVDVGHSQLHSRLRGDSRVVCIEHCNARELTLAQCGQSSGFALIVADLSFISLTLVLPALKSVMSELGQMLLLVKPQFELQASDIGKGGVVKDATKYVQVEQRLREAALAMDLHVSQWLPSAISGGDGNQEFFIHLRRTACAKP
jgi:23S rRNA (cytidine1920-2'-O)/16S rRNA (cytidine1409-2'-O)-methyltransferase